MKDITKTKSREIIEDFAKEIREHQSPGPKPSKTVIDFRTDKKDGKERKVFWIPIEFLRYRKDNGRIASDVLDYELHYGVLQEGKQECQDRLKGFLLAKDKEKTEELKAAIEHSGQQEPAIITCDGFLINGNRRKMVLELLKEKDPGNPDFAFMKVVILPGKDDRANVPTLLEIEQIENRYQLQSDGKAEYYGFDRALSIRKKVQLGMSIEAQLKDDPVHAGLRGKEFKNAVEKVKNEYLRPLECIDRYLTSLRRRGFYSSVAKGMGDPEGRWQAFIDYSQKYPQFADPAKRMKLGISEEEVGNIEQSAFTIIRKRDFGHIGLKAHNIMRELPKWLEHKDSKRELLKLAELPQILSKEECTDKDGNEISERDKDRKWGEKHASYIINHVKKARDLYEHKRDRETPIN
ncbi:MAG: hypothetical protein KAW46_12655, partial [candidate division Zixibacteria bacterium]|nr:hypothetical protein [candidate division Zixibacteria bacterium]